MAGGCLNTKLEKFESFIQREIKIDLSVVQLMLPISNICQCFYSRLVCQDMLSITKLLFPNHIIHIICRGMRMHRWRSTRVKCLFSIHSTRCIVLEMFFFFLILLIHLKRLVRPFRSSMLNTLRFSILPFATNPIVTIDKVIVQRTLIDFLYESIFMILSIHVVRTTSILEWIKST